MLSSVLSNSPHFLQWGFFLSLPSSSIVSLLPLCVLSGSPEAVVLNWCFSVSAFILRLVFPSSHPPHPPSLPLRLPLHLLCIPDGKRQASEKLPLACVHQASLCVSVCACCESLAAIFLYSVFLLLYCLHYNLAVYSQDMELFCAALEERILPLCAVFFTISLWPQFAETRDALLLEPLF